MSYNSFLCPFKSFSTCDLIPSVPFDKRLSADNDHFSAISKFNPIFNDGPVVKFDDNLGRSAIAIKFYLSCNPEVNELGLENGEYATVAFQRYSDDKSFWSYSQTSQNYMEISALKMISSSTSLLPDFDWLESLIKNQEAKSVISQTAGDKVFSSECSVTLTNPLVTEESNLDYHVDL